MHCGLIVEHDGSFSLVDMGSTNGTYVSGRRIENLPVKVEPEDRLRIGAFETTLANLLVQLQDSKSAARIERTKIFVSYRRASTEQVAGRIYDNLAAHFGADNIFFDTAAIPGAVDFRRQIQSAIEQSSSVVAIMGKGWAKRKFRWFAPRSVGEDFVVIELEEAIKKRVPIVPVLVDGAVMPTVNDFPGSVQSIAYLNAITVRAGRDFQTDMGVLVETLSRYRP
jgi:hypothetical protein